MESHSLSEEIGTQLQNVKDLSLEERQSIREKVLRDGEEFLRRMRQLTEDERVELLNEGKNTSMNWRDLPPEKKEVLEPILIKLFTHGE